MSFDAMSYLLGVITGINIVILMAIPFELVYRWFLRRLGLKP